MTIFTPENITILISMTVAGALVKPLVDRLEWLYIRSEKYIKRVLRIIKNFSRNLKKYLDRERRSAIIELEIEKHTYRRKQK